MHPSLLCRSGLVSLWKLLELYFVFGVPECTIVSLWLYFLKIFLMFIYFGDRERQSMSGGGAERAGDTESEAGSRL